MDIVYDRKRSRVRTPAGASTVGLCTHGPRFRSSAGSSASLVYESFFEGARNSKLARTQSRQSGTKQKLCVVGKHACLYLSQRDIAIYLFLCTQYL